MRSVRFAILAILVSSIVCLGAPVSMAHWDFPSGTVRQATMVH